MNQVRLLGALMLALLLGTFSLFAQSDSTSVSGTITDPSGAAVANAKVVVKNQNTGLVREVTTNISGTYSIPSIPSGVYTMTVEVSGFKKFESKSNKFDAAAPSTINAVMQVGAVNDTITVEAQVGAIQTETSALGKLVEGKQVSDLQLNGRNPLFLSLLKPGVRGGSLANFDYGLTTGGLQINGSRTQDNLIAMDGAVGVRTRSNGTSIGTADLDAVAEAHIREQGAVPSFKGYHGFPATICASLNDEIVHGIGAPDRIIRDGDLVSLDVVVRRQAAPLEIADPFGH